MADVKDVYVLLTANTDQFVAAMGAASDAADATAADVSGAMDGMAADVDATTADITASVDGMTADLATATGAIDTTMADTASTVSGSADVMAGDVVAADATIAGSATDTAATVGIASKAMSDTMDGAASRIGVSSGLMSSAMGGPVLVVGALLAALTLGSVDLAAKMNEAEVQVAQNAHLTIQSADDMGTAFEQMGNNGEFSAQQVMTAFAPVATPPFRRHREHVTGSALRLRPRSQSRRTPCIGRGGHND